MKRNLDIRITPWSIWLNVDGLDAEDYEMDKQRLQMYVGRYITNAKGYLKNVCIGVFPKSDRKWKCN